MEFGWLPKAEAERRADGWKAVFLYALVDWNYKSFKKLKWVLDNKILFGVSKNGNVIDRIVSRVILIDFFNSLYNIRCNLAYNFDFTPIFIMCLTPLET